MKKSLARLFFIVVFLIPVTWYLFLQFFGENSFTLELLDSTSCEAESIIVLRNIDSLSVAQTNYFQRVKYGTEIRNVPLINSNDSTLICANIYNKDLLLINKKGLWGQYELSREGVDQLLTELDILMIQENYGEPVSR